MTSGEPLIAIEGVSLAYRTRDYARQALRGASVAALAGEIVTIEGPAGAGKTSLLRVAAGLLEPDDGTVHFDGADLAAMPASRRRALRGGPIALLPEGGGLLPTLSVAEQIDLAMRIAGLGRSERATRRGEQLAANGLAHLAARRPHELTPRERALAALARAMAVEPRLLLADEPAAAMDAEALATLERQLALLTARSGAALLTTDREAVGRLATRRLAIEDGRLRPATPFAEAPGALPMAGPTPGGQAAG